jgi:hypothetical protein
MQLSKINTKCLPWIVAGALAVLCVVSSSLGPQAIWAQANSPLTIRSVAVGGAASQPGVGVEVEVKTSGPVAPTTQAISGPDRIVIDFPGALPASTLHALAVHRGGLKTVRAALFQAEPPITRVVLDVDGPTDYQVFPAGNSIVIKLGRPGPTNGPSNSAAVATVVRRVASRSSASQLPALQITNTVAGASSSNAAAAEVVPVVPPKPRVDVGVRSNLLSIRAEGATLAEVLYEVHRRTGAEIAIPAGAEQERVVVNMGPAPGKEVIASLLNGSRFNYILLGSDADPGGFRNLLLSLKSGGNSGVFVHTTQPQFASGALGGQPPAITTPPDPGAEQTGVEQAAEQAGVPQAEPELEPVPDEAPATDPNAEASPNNPRPGMPQQFPVQNIPDAGQPPQ